MFTRFSHRHSKFFIGDKTFYFSPDLIEDNLLEIEKQNQFLFDINSPINEQEKINSFYFENFKRIIPINEFGNSDIPLKEEEDDINDDELYFIKSNEKTKKISSTKFKEKIFNITKLQNISLFNNIDSSIDGEDIGLLMRKRSAERVRRIYDNDNIRTKIKRGFLNAALVYGLNKILKTIGSKHYFETFPSQFASDVNKERNNIIIDMTLLEIFENETLYSREDEKGKANYFHNLKVVQSMEIKENKIVRNILNKTFTELYLDYLRSDDFRIKEINRLKNSKMEDDYIKKYIILAKDLINFFSN